MKLTDKEQIIAIRRRNEYLIGKIYILYRSEFINYFKGKVWKDSSVVLDIYQDAFIVLCNKVYERKIDEDNLTSSLKTYLFGIGKYISININRKKGNYSEQLLSELPDIPDEETGMGEENDNIIQTAVNEMGEPCHTILVKQYWEDKSGEEIAVEMNYKNKDAAKTQKYKCIQKLKNELKGKIVYQN